MSCPCKKPDGDDRAYPCEHLTLRTGVNTKMTPIWCRLYLTRDNYRQAWDEGHGPGQPALPSPPKSKRPERKGPGTELKKLLSQFGIKPAGGCGCQGHSATMDRKGAAWCRLHVDDIATWLVTEADRKKWPMSERLRPMAKLLIRWAIRRAENHSIHDGLAT